MKVMIVDDNAAIRETIKAMLTKGADTCCECSDGSEALNLYGQCHPDWVLMDIKMKHMDGFEATRAIISEFPDAKVIMITQYDDPKLKKKAYSAGAVDFVLKEHLFDIEQIIQGNRN